MDEMAIRKQIQYNEKRFVGYVGYGLIIEDPENLPVAKEALISRDTIVSRAKFTRSGKRRETDRVS